MRLLYAVLAVSLIPVQRPTLARLTFTSPEAAFAIVRFQLEEPPSPPAAAAVDIIVNGVRDQTVVVTPGARVPSYAALLGPLAKGSHEVRIEPSTLWNWPTASDLPLWMYAEDVTGNGTRWLKYSVIFSNEDGGTPAAALMARWGRTTDIELAYEVELRDGRVVQGRYQGPDHRVIPKARLEVRPPLLLSPP
jgi:hypothetical protein